MELTQFVSVVASAPEAADCTAQCVRQLLDMLERQVTFSKEASELKRCACLWPLEPPMFLSIML